MAEFTNDALQTVNPGEDIIYTITKVPCFRGFVRHEDGTGSFLCQGFNMYARKTRYLVDFGANIAIPTGGTVGPISVAITVNGSTVPATIMTVTPAAVEEFFNVSRTSSVGIWSGCCQTVSIRNVSDQPILVQNTNIVIDK